MNNQSPQSSCKANRMLPINDTWKMKVDKPLLPISSYNEHFYCLYSKDSQRGTQCLRKFDLKTALNQRRRKKTSVPFGYLFSSCAGRGKAPRWLASNSWRQYQQSCEAARGAILPQREGQQTRWLPRPINT